MNNTEYNKQQVYEKHCGSIELAEFLKMLIDNGNHIDAISTDNHLQPSRHIIIAHQTTNNK